MGVKSLWEILHAACSMMEISDLKNETIAVDLATWICEAENAGMMKNSVEKPYLRNLFYRVSNLTLHGVKLIFVTDGKSPRLKWNTIAQRLDSRSDLSHSSHHFTGSRSRLNAKFAECCALLDQLGIVWMKADGEAEATCAALNQQGYATGCATTDGDAFLYGATKVYRNLACRKGAKFECYEMKAIKEKLHLDRNSLISLGLILGCDYFQSGIPGVGKVNALKLLGSWRQKGNPLDLMRKWKNREKSNSGIKKPKHCTHCKHSGTKQDHAGLGCSVCLFQCRDGRVVTLECTCEWHLSGKNREANALEDRIATKAKQIPDFPNEEIISEFLQQRYVVSPESPSPPSLDGTAQFLKTRLGWHDGISKTFPMITHWVLNHPDQDLGLSITSIHRTRTKDKVKVYEIEWCEPLHGNFTTCEEQTAVERRFPDVVKTFQERLEKEKQDKKTLKKLKAKESKNAKTETKMTDFYKKVKKVRNNSTRHPTSQSDDSADPDVALIGASLATIDLTTSSPHPPASTDDPPASNYEEQFTRASDVYPPTKGLNLEDSDPGCTLSCISRNLRETSGNCLRTNNNVSLNLNFSLGNSLLKTPGKENNFQPISCIDNSLQHDEGTASPVFLSLAERIKLKTGSEDKN